ncbi:MULTISPECIES: hypothetical protein [unclassified Sphingomonas]|uniref:hypothetical protein n=1 Tax=unclassified Sphingomonas TaxID=196159 RepID=UPI001F5754DE|nr:MULTISPECIES: hypothetical protein [unclassified Sphingomonas]
MTAPPSASIAALAVLAVAALFAIGLLVRMALRRGGDRIDSPEEAASAAESALPRFAARNAVVGADGAAALVVGEDARLAVLRRRGRRHAVHEIGWSAVRSTAGGIVVETGDRRLGDVALAGVDVLDVRRMAP